MPLIDTLVECPVFDSFRVRQVAGLFDLPLPKVCTERFTVELPDESEDWQIGVIVGPSGTGKSTIARHAFGDRVYTAAAWPADRAVIDAFGEVPIKQIVQTLTSVGFSSPPAWIKPYRVLSNGEKFRCDLARAMVDSGFGVQGSGNAEEGSRFRGQGSGNADASVPSSLNPEPRTLNPLTCFDEFTSVVDRTVAKIGSAAVASAIRSGRIQRRFVAVTCHYDIIPWLEPDWVLDVSGPTLTRGRLRRPNIQLDIRRAHHSQWPLFKRHHYLSGSLHRSAACFIGYVDDRPATFTAVLPFPHADRPGWREHRLVCLPDFQGVGLGNAASEFVAAMYRATGKPYFSTTSHPGMIRHRCRSPLWRVIRPPRQPTRPHTAASIASMARRSSASRLTAGFEYVGPCNPEAARRHGITRTA